MLDKNSTRYYSDKQEKAVCKALDGQQQANSGAGHFAKSDVIIKDISMLIECKTAMTEKSSFSIKKDWLEKSKQEAFSSHCDYTALAFNFGPDTKNYYVISELLMKTLVEYLRSEQKQFY